MIAANQAAFHASFGPFQTKALLMRLNFGARADDSTSPHSQNPGNPVLFNQRDCSNDTDKGLKFYVRSYRCRTVPSRSGHRYA
jgi:hypothetical protein